MKPRNPLRYALGIDAGPASAGWAVIELDNDDQPIGLHNAGVRRFDAGVEGDLKRGKDETLSKKRRDARGPRRQTWRRQWRLRKVFRVLQRVGLLPKSESAEHDARHALLIDLDRKLQEESLIAGNRVASHTFHYRLRALSLSQPLSAQALGRVFYHLAQRRGFLSNLKTGRDSDERSIVKKGISELQTEMGNRTLGEYFSTLDPEESRIRKRWTARRMYRDEFERIWQAQQPHHSILTEEVKTALEEAIFHQRPLKSQRGLIGRCDLECYKRRVAAAALPFQTFRMLQRVNDLEVTCPDGEIRKLDETEHTKLLGDLNREGDLTWAKVRTSLGMKKSNEYGRNYEFNFEKGGDKKLVGNRTGTKLATALGTAWQSLAEEMQTRLVDDILSFEDEAELIDHLQRRWELSEPQAMAVADLRLEAGYGSLSRRAIRRLLPLMQQGISFATARKEKYADRLQTKEAVDCLPPFLHVMKTVRNPAVSRTMSELRKVVNALIREHGKPQIIRIELARDLKHSRKRRKQMTTTRDQNTASREKAYNRLLKEMGERYATDRNILKLRLADECNWICPYTGRGSIGMEELVGDQSHYDIEHIIPFSQSLDNSFANKTLCYHEENRNRKLGKTPFEAYGRSAHWEEIIGRVRHFKNDFAARKLQLFQTETLPDAEEFASRQLNDTRYLSRAAAEYLACLYGGRCDAAGTSRIQVSPGRVTGYLRRVWDLNRILGSPDQKSRADHRHHAIDAFLIGVSDSRIVKMLSEAAERAETLGLRDLFVDIQTPWEHFQWTQVKAVVDRILVSSRVNRKLNGALHEETILSNPKPDNSGKNAMVHHVRKPLAKMSHGEVGAIVDLAVRTAVLDKLEKIGGEPKTAFADPSNHPYLTSRDGRLIPIHSARIRKPDASIAVGKGSRLRHVCPGENHHLEIIAELNTDGKHKKWKGRIVSRFEAMQRWRNNEPVVSRNHGAGTEFVFSLTNGEHVMLPGENGTQKVLRVTVISGDEIELVEHQDARPITVRKKIPGARIRIKADRLRTSEGKKAVLDPLGKWWPAGD